jgi:hypothetical protein
VGLTSAEGQEQGYFKGGGNTIFLYYDDLEQFSIFASMTTSQLHSQLKCLRFLSLLIRLFAYQTQASSLGVLIAFANTCHFTYLCI